MKLRNSTDWPDHFLRRMVAWCCKELDHPSRRVLAARFANSRASWGGRAYIFQRRIGVCIGAAANFPETPKQHQGMPRETINDRDECLVWVTAHEVAHLMQYDAERNKRPELRSRRGGYGGSEHHTDWFAYRVLATFRANRDALMAEWSATPKQRDAKPKPSAVERRAAKVHDDLARWSRKLKLAQTKVRKLKQKVRYYERTAATRVT